MLVWTRLTTTSICRFVYRLTAEHPRVATVFIFCFFLASGEGGKLPRSTSERVLFLGRFGSCSLWMEGSDHPRTSQMAGPCSVGACVRAQLGKRRKLPPPAIQSAPERGTCTDVTLACTLSVENCHVLPSVLLIANGSRIAYGPFAECWRLPSRLRALSCDGTITVS